MEYDEAVIHLSDIKAKLEKCGHHCHGELVPRHICTPEDPPREQAGTARRLAALGRRPDHTHPAHHEAKGQAVTHAAHDMMAHEMGHGAGMDMKEMVRDMRNRFWICLVFTIPIFLYAPMGMQFPMPAPPFGLALNEWLFLLASAAILYPIWPSFVSS